MTTFGWGWRVLRFAPFLFLILFFFYPLGSILQESFAPDGSLNLQSLRELATSGYYWRILGFTLAQAALSTLLTLVCALPAAYVFATYRFPGKTLLMALATLPFVLPTVVVSVAFAALIGPPPRGVLNSVLMQLFALQTPPIQLQNTLAAILIVHVFYNYAIVLRMVGGYWANLNPRIEEAARTLGAHGWQLWWSVTLPLLRPALTAAALLVFIFCFTSFGVVLILGGPRFATLEVEIFRQATGLFNLPMAAALSLVQIGVLLLLLLFYTGLQQRIATGVQRADSVTRRPRLLREKLFVAGNLLVMAALLFVPLLALLLRSVTTADGQLSGAHYAALFRDERSGILLVTPIAAMLNSLRFALTTTIVALLLGLLAAYLLGGRLSRRGRWLDALFMLPLATSAVTLGFGFILSMDFDGVRRVFNALGFNIAGDWDLRTSAALVVLAHILVALPFVVRSVLPALRRIPPSVQEAASVLGASPVRVWYWIDLPLISRGLFVGGIFAFTVSMGEFGASMFVARPEATTMPLAIYRLLSRPGAENYGQALAMSVLLLVVCTVSFVLIERVRVFGIGEF